MRPAHLILKGLLMTKDFNSDMFAALLNSNEKTLALLTEQMTNAQKIAKWNEIKFYITVTLLALLLGAFIWLYFNKKEKVNVIYEQQAEENTISEGSSIKNGNN